MAKFYIQSGEIRFVVNAADAEGAAMWALNQSIERCLPVEMKGCRKLESNVIEWLIQGADLLDAEIAVSEIGLGRDDAGVFDTEILFYQWYQLMCAMDHLLDRLGE